MRKPKVAYGTQGVKTKVPESKLTLQIALKLEKELKKRGYDVYMIRRKQNVNISNKQRAIRANKSGADICIRLHADAKISECSWRFCAIPITAESLCSKIKQEE